MMRSRAKQINGALLTCLAAMALAVSGFGMKAGGQDTKETKVAIPAEQVIAAIKTAVAAKPGNVQAVEAEKEGGRVICEVEVLAQDGRTYEVGVDVATNRVVEVDDDTEEDKEDD